MQIEKMTTALRPRQGWEAIDLGFSLARVWFWRLWLLWLVPALAIFIIVELLLHHYRPAPIIIFWWFKPLFELPLLFYLSRVLFGEFPSIGNIWKNYFSIVKTQLFAALTWRRLSLSRSANNPVHLLERLSGSQRKERLKVLHTCCGHSASWLTIICYHFEMILWFGFILFISYLIPEELDLLSLESVFFSEESGSDLISDIIYFLSMSLIAPFYTASGFSLYLSARTQLEGWDIELGFKNMMNRIHLQKGKTIAAALLILFVLPLPEQGICMNKEDAKQLIEEIAASPDFGKLESEHRWQRITQVKEKPDSLPEFLKKLAAWLVMAAAYLAKWIEAILWTCLIFLLIWLIHRYTNWLQVLGLFNRSRDSTPRVPETLFGMSLNTESLPDDVLAETKRHISAKNYRAALSLLYRASLLKLILKHQIKIAESATENECVALVDQSRPAEESQYFRRLTGLWLKMAYAGDAPEDEELRNLTEQWGQIYGGL